MQDSYVGDIGDLAKLGLLRALGKGKRRLGVAWYLYPHEEGPDGQHIEYFNQCDSWRPVDPDLFDGLHGIIDRWQNHQGERCVMDPTYLGLLPGAVFADDMLCHHPRNGNEPDRSCWRHRWFDGVMTKLRDCDIVFADPDNGLCADDKFHYDGRGGDWKRMPLREALILSANRTAVIYHHNSHFIGGVDAEIKQWMKKLPGCTHAFRCRRYGNRTFFVLNADNATIHRLTAFVKRWQKAELRSNVRDKQCSELISLG